MSKHAFLVFAVAVSLATPLIAADTTQRVQFARGDSSKTLAGTVRGYDSVNYIIGARAGQTMTVTFRPRNTSAYINIWAPGADEAMFIGSSEGSSFAGTLSASGDYRVQVYLMRNAARRNESSTYRLTIGVR